MKRQLELLAPGGDLDSIKAAIAAGADAVYCGLIRFNARNRAANISIEDLNGVLRLAHQNNCQVFLTLNIIIVETEIRSFVSLLNTLINTGIDGIILQDLGMLYLISKYFKGFKVHASTQLTTHNEGQIDFLHKLGVTRVNLSRELSLNEIKPLVEVAHNTNILTEVFVHGSHCISFSGLCYISSVFDGKSGNRGRCSQPCRDEYLPTPCGISHPLNLKDNSAYADVKALADAGVDSIKIEGRIKKFHYVYTVVNAWRKQLQKLYQDEQINTEPTILHKVFNRGFTNGFLHGNINKDMFIDNPRDNSARHRAELYGGVSDENIEKAKREIYDERTEIITKVKKKIEALSLDKIPATLQLSGKADSRLKITVTTPTASFNVLSKTSLIKVNPSPDTEQSPSGKPPRDNRANLACVLEHFKTFTDLNHVISLVDSNTFDNTLFLTFNEIRSVAKQISLHLSSTKSLVKHVEIPRLKRQSSPQVTPTLSVLISSETDLQLRNASSAEFFYQLPNCLTKDRAKHIAFFKNNDTITPWFPSILIGEEYRSAVKILKEAQPKRIVTNNTGIAHEASKRGISWIAGPYLNIANSYSLLCLQAFPGCSGAFVSNELNRFQVKLIRKPENFNLYYSIYHPILLMKSRQCLFHQVTGCSKDSMDENCLKNCKKSASITSLKDTLLYLNKSHGNFNCLYNAANYLNTDVVTNPPNTFTSFFVDLRDIHTQTRFKKDRSAVLKTFEELIQGHSEAQRKLFEIITPTTNVQYQQGI